MSEDATPYWLIATPITSGYSPQDDWNSLTKKTQGEDLSTNFKFNLPIKDLKVGTLDSLMALSDDLVRFDTLAEGTAFKIMKQLNELQVNEPPMVTLPDVGGRAAAPVSVDAYVRSFAWDDAKYPVKSPLKELTELIVGAVARMDEELKAKATEFANAKGAKVALERKEAGNLMVRSLDALVKSSDFIDSEHLTTLLVVVPKFGIKDWTSNYATLGGQPSFVVPGSSKQITEDADTALMTVTLFRSVVETFKTNCRERRFLVRDFSYSAKGVADEKAAKDKISSDFDKLKVMFVRWCKTNFAEAYSAMMHLKGVRLFVESTLRYGVPPNFQAVLLKPKKDLPLRKALDSLYGHLASTEMIGSNEEEVMPGQAGEFYPYVYLNVLTEPALV
ncbi:hypothetical protein KFE25_005201 [Diacronema lutheri]|uniref:V-type proton ATPase subunit C n=1 Tax=Diacronema lutheri TaxID=2081491 RepID=A0A8J5X6F4_DIALT|nr:hypothetical protein KFE25_005201 [Diacronema lutheri]